VINCEALKKVRLVLLSPGESAAKPSQENKRKTKKTRDLYNTKRGGEEIFVVFVGRTSEDSDAWEGGEKLGNHLAGKKET